MSVILHGLVVEWWIDILKVPGLNPVQGEENSNFGETFDFCYICKKTIFCHKKLPLLKPILALPT